MRKATLFAILLFFILFCGNSLMLLSQERYEPNKVIPPSPTAASLGIYGEFPVSYYTGSTNFSIPLYTVQTNQHSLPITLQYNTSGIKVGQDASWVGLGWSLSAGGLITRSIRGLDDLRENGYYLLGAMPPYTVDNEYAHPGEGTPEAYDYAYYFRDIKIGAKDGEPDVFYYNFAGYTGKFVIGKQVHGGRIFTAEINNLKISYSGVYTNGAYGTWTVTTPNGFKYYFNTPEVVEGYYSNTLLPDAALQGLNTQYFTRSYNESVSSWYLDSIVSPVGEKIIFTYETGRSLSSVVESQRRYDRLNGGLSEVTNYFKHTRSDIRDVYLRKIQFNAGYLLFNRSARIDIEPFPGNVTIPQKLSNIELYNNSDQFLKRYVLEHSYFNNNNTGLSYHYKRLKLEGLTEVGSDGISNNPYLFNYFDPENLPSKYNRQVDIWGYFASFPTSTLPNEFRTTLLPTVTYASSEGIKTFPGVERTPDSTGNLIKKGVLTDVTYPTGGKTVLNFEPNEYPEVKTITQTTGGEIYTAYVNDDWLPEENKPTQDFDLAVSTSVTLTLHAYQLSSDDPVPTDDMAYIVNRSNNSIYAIYNLINGTPVSGNPANKTQTWNFTLPAGNYRLQCSQIFYVSVHCSIKCGEEQTTTTYVTVNKKGGGLRIKGIVNYDYNDKVISSKQIVYTNDGSISGLSSGVVYKPLQHFVQHVVNCGYDYEGNAMVRSSTTMSPLGMLAEAGPVCYSQVYVYEGENGEGGSTHYTYHNTPTPIGTDARDCQVPPDVDGLNGKLILTKVRDKNGIVLKTNTYQYELKQTRSLKGVVMVKPYMDDCQFFWSIDQVKYYDNKSEWWVLSAAVEESILNGRIVTVNKNNYYDDTTHRQLTRETVNQSDGGIITTTYKYPVDFASQAPYNDMVNNKYIIGPVIEQNVTKNGSQISAVKNNYNNWAVNVAAPVTVQSRKGAGSWDTRTRYLAYDDKGNILSASKEDDVVSSYVWGFNKTYPIVKAENLSVSSLNSIVAEVLTEMGYTNGISSLDSYLATLSKLNATNEIQSWKTFNSKLYSKLPSKSMVTTFTYLPLIGVTSSTNVNNKTIYFEYDGLGRLTVVRDHDRNILKTYCYRYKGQAGNCLP